MTFAPNGCGPKGGWIRPPQWLFRSDCNWHDLAYDLGGDEAKRREVDREFYRRMLVSVRAAPRWARPWMRVQAWLYWRAVRIWGGRRFNYHDGVPRWLEPAP